VPEPDWRSYLIYSPAFDALPRGAKDPIYKRLGEVLSGQERAERYQLSVLRGFTTDN
jgi:hypothetical protein